MIFEQTRDFFFRMVKNKPIRRTDWSADFYFVPEERNGSRLFGKSYNHLHPEGYDDFWTISEGFNEDSRGHRWTFWDLSNPDKIACDCDGYTLVNFGHKCGRKNP